jgi:PBP1b-binding outer membrane lipoprotein LpoB
MMKKKMKAVFVCAAVLSGIVLLTGCPKKKSGAQEIIDAAKNLGKTVEKNAPSILKDLGKTADKAEEAVKKAANSDTAKKVGDVAKDAADIAADAVDAAKKAINKATEN